MCQKFALVICCLLAMLAAPPGRAGGPSLIVVVSVDQLRRDRLDPESPGGLGRVVRQGRVFTNATLNHAISSTCPGHASILTGMNPGKAGIPGNNYIDRESWSSRYCLEDSNDAYRVFGRDENRSPRNLRVTTLGDWLQSRYPEGKVFGIAGKDRAAIAMAGHHADGVFWFDKDRGQFTSSGYYMDRLPEYVRALNGEEPFANDGLADLPDARVAEQDTAVFKLARRLIEVESLGTDGSPDLLALGLSATDLVGHAYGPFSEQSADTLGNVDRELGSFLAFLDDRFGRGEYVLVLTADHGVAARPEAGRGEGDCPVAPARVNIYTFAAKMYWQIYSRFTFPFDMPTRLVKFSGSQISINNEYARARGLDVAEVTRWVEQWLEAKPVVSEVWSVEEIVEGQSAEARLYRNSLVRDKSGDLMLQVHAGCLIGEGEGTNHGTPYWYDRNVPLVFHGWGVESGELDMPAHTIDIAPTLARLIGLRVPVEVHGRPLPLRDDDAVARLSVDPEDAR